MAEFATELTLHIRGPGLWEVHGGIEYWSDLVEPPIIVPDGFITDLTSLPPWVPEYLIQRNGQHRAAAIVHDYLCRSDFDRPLADRIFLEAMKVVGESRWRRYTMYWAVSLYTKWLQLRGKI